MEALEGLRRLGGLLAPPRCATCAAACEVRAPLCSSCARRLARTRPGESVVAGVGSLSWAASYDGIARELVRALKFDGRLALAELAGAAIARAVGFREGWTVIPVPAAPLRRRMRGFDPAERIAAAVARRLGLALAQPLARGNGRRQVGRPRSERLADRPQVRAVAPAPSRALLVDDVLTTGATLGSSAAALRGAGCIELHAAVFARTLGTTCASAYHSS